MTEYIDARELHPEYDRKDCPHCGETRWFKYVTPNDRWDDLDPYWNCLTCRKRFDRELWVACPDCDGRMVAERDPERWHCRVCGGERPLDRTALIERMSTDYRTGYIESERCPVCGERFGVWADPDGAAICRECEDFYAGQYSDFGTDAEWLTRRGLGGRHEAPDWIRVDA